MIARATVVRASCGSNAGYGYKVGQDRTVAIEESRGSLSSYDSAGNGCAC